MEEQHEEKADELERTADDLEQQGSKADGHIEEARADWKSKLSDQKAPGATEPADAAPGGLGEDDSEDGDSG